MDGISHCTGKEQETKGIAVNIAKLKVTTVIEISPDTEVLKKPKSWSSRNKSPQSSLTSTQIARSKAARCPKQPNVVDIDAQDVANELAAVEYVEDIYKFYKLIENESMVHDYMHMQPKITQKNRESLIDWLIEVHDAFDLMNETLYLTINIVDRFLANETVAKTELRCVGVSAMLLASKYVEMRRDSMVYDFVGISDNRYDERDVLVMEKRILSRLEWSLTVPTPYVFLTRFIKAAATATELEIDVEQMVYFYAELGMINYYIIIRYCPSMVAASAVYAARSALNKNPVWHETLEMHTGFTETQVMECVKMMVVSHIMVKDGEKRKAVYEKYSSNARGMVALYSPPKTLLL
ncbi:hypothetical protein L2E82_41028 [Cichorium intybus]|uniref:Uncharacterized protein n=1 Tax=Cichorium intybus TaxID=13427 RepID=A0ACB9ALW5_CICIN|nr:hypothetical protein L2E82_41028 [Cichorium intybus]